MSLFLKTLRIKNLFQFKDVCIELSPQTNLILGANGSGKSNILNCIMYALTGDLPFKKDLCVRKGASGDDSFVVLTMEYDNKEIVLTRHLKDKVNIYYDNKSFYGVNDVSNILKSLGFNKNIFESCNFLKQGEIRKFINSTPREKVQLFLDILNISKLNLLYQDLGSFIREYASKYNVDYTKEYNEYIKLKSIYDSYPPIRPISVLLDIKSKRSKIKHIEDLISKKINDLNKIDENIKQLEKLKDSLDQNNIPYQSVSEVENTFKYCNLLIKIKSKYDQVLNTWRSRPKPVLFSETELISIEKDIYALDHLIKQIKQNIHQLENKNICPLCMTPLKNDITISNLKRLLLQKQQERDEKEKRKKQLEIIKKDYEQRNEIKSQIRRLKEEKQNISSLGYSVSDPSAFIEQYQFVKKLVQKRLQCEQEFAIFEDRRKQYIKEIADLRKELDELTQELESTEEDIEKEIEIHNKKVEIETLMKEKEKYMQLHKEAEIKKKRLNNIEIVRNYLKYDGLPRMLLSIFFDKFVSTINSFLNKLNANFQLNIDFSEEINFEILYKNGIILHDRHLSYGEQLMLALSIAISLVLLLSNVRILILDEPTLGLDDDHIGVLPQFFTTIASMRTLQIICATHEMSLTQIATKLILTESLHTSMIQN